MSKKEPIIIKCVTEDLHCSHRVPVNCAGHVQMNSLDGLTVHVPPFKHGLVRQGSIGKEMSHNIDEGLPCWKRCVGSLFRGQFRLGYLGNSHY